MKNVQKQFVGLVSGLLLVSAAWSADTAADEKQQAQKVLSDMHHSNQMEIQMGTLAKEKGASEQIRTYGERLMKDHREADQQVQDLAKKSGYTLEETMDHGMMEKAKATKQMNTMAELSKKSGGEFDKSFAEAMVDDHKRDISKLEKARKNVTQPEVRELITKVLPTLQEHLELAQQLRKS